MKAPGAKTGSLAELLDLFPTLSDLCGLPPPGGVEGTSLVPVLDDPNATVNEAAYTQHPRPAYYQGEPEVMGRSVRTARRRYTEWRDFKTGELVGAELYDHDTDPWETVNRVADAAHQAAAERCRRLLSQLPTPGN